MWRYRRAQEQARIISELKAIGCYVAYDFEIQENQYGELIYFRNSKSSISESLLKWLGPDFFHEVAAAEARDSHSGHPKSDEEISQFWTAVVGFSKLRLLDSDAAWCRSQEFNQVAGKESLRAVTISGHHLTNAQLKTIGSIPNLQAIDIYLNRSEIDDDGVNELSRLKQLRSISIDCFRLLDNSDDEPPITGAAVTNLCRCTKLESVVLPFKRLNNNSARELAKLPHLRRLDLSHSDLSDAGIAHFKNSLELEEIVINHTGVSGPGFLQLRELPRVRKLCMQ
ncbi:MAG TPA: hypothetical protein VM260_11045, partial [Pirellula sp.]|nr:hypothetical protein [Pirellula sp.]